MTPSRGGTTMDSVTAEVPEPAQDGWKRCLAWFTQHGVA